MLWQDIMEKHPKKWLVIEAKKFHQADDKFVIEDLEVLDVFDKPGRVGNVFAHQSTYSHCFDFCSVYLVSFFLKSSKDKPRYSKV